MNDSKTVGGESQALDRRGIIEKIKLCESECAFDAHIDPINYNIALPVTEDFKYINKGFKQEFLDFFRRLFIVRPFAAKVNKDFNTVVTGRENLKNIKSAIVTCNHINKFDCMVVKKAMKGHNLYYTVADFNNQKGFLGDMMRAEGIMPMGKSLACMRNFNNAADKILKKNNYILFYPEQSMWWNYEKPRPFKKGAFHYAVKFGVPIVPAFITFKDTDKLDSEGITEKQFFIHILPPVFCDENKQPNENVRCMMEQNFELCRQKYEEFYGRELVYDTKRGMLKPDEL